MLNDDLCIWDNKVIRILYCSVFIIHLYYNRYFNNFFFLGKGHLANEVEKVENIFLNALCKHTETAYLWNAVRVGEHRLKAVVHADVVEDAHGDLLVVVIAWGTRNHGHGD